MTETNIALALHAPEQNVSANWPLIEAAISALGIDSRLVRIAAAATVAIECPSFKPQSEKYNGDPLVYFRRYDGRTDLGNTTPGDGYRFRGRGFIQITGRYNYGVYSKHTGRDLTANPDDVLIPSVAAQILAYFFANRDIPGAANAEDWQRVRRLVNGGDNGMTPFMDAVNKLKEIM